MKEKSKNLNTNKKEEKAKPSLPINVFNAICAVASYHKGNFAAGNAALEQMGWKEKEVKNITYWKI